MRTKLALKDKKRKKLQGRAKKRLLYNIRFLGNNNCLKLLVENKKHNTNAANHTSAYEDIPSALYLNYYGQTPVISNNRAKIWYY